MYAVTPLASVDLVDYVLASATPRQRQILGLLTQGYTGKKIGKTLHLGSHQVSKHLLALADLYGISTTPIHQTGTALAGLFALMSTPALVGQYRWRSLSPRQTQVAELTVENLTAKEIALKIGAAPETVRKHLGAVYKHIGVSNKLELVTWYAAHYPL